MGSYVNVIFPKARGGENVTLITLTADVLLLLCKPSTSAGGSAPTADKNTGLGAGGWVRAEFKEKQKRAPVG